MRNILCLLILFWIVSVDISTTFSAERAFHFFEEAQFEEAVFYKYKLEHSSHYFSNVKLFKCSVDRETLHLMMEEIK